MPLSRMWRQYAGFIGLSVVSRIFASWNQIGEWLRRLDVLRWVA